MDGASAPGAPARGVGGAAGPEPTLINLERESWPSGLCASGEDTLAPASRADRHSASAGRADEGIRAMARGRSGRGDRGGTSVMSRSPSRRSASGRGTDPQFMFLAVERLGFPHPKCSASRFVLGSLGWGCVGGKCLSVKTLSLMRINLKITWSDFSAKKLYRFSYVKRSKILLLAKCMLSVGWLIGILCSKPVIHPFASRHSLSLSLYFFLKGGILLLQGQLAGGRRAVLMRRGSSG